MPRCVETELKKRLRMCSLVVIKVVGMDLVRPEMRGRGTCGEVITFMHGSVVCHEQRKSICRYHSGEKKTATPRFDGDGKGDLQTDVAENHGALITTMKECQYTWLERMGR